MTDEVTIIVFVKNPVLGKVKTRLAASVGDQRAMEIYLQLLKHTRQTLMELTDVRRVVYYSDFADAHDQWSGSHFDKKVQSSGDLGHRMSVAVHAELQQSSKVIIIGSDCAQLTSQHLRMAVGALASHNTVVGPSMDGGYYLLGMDDHYAFLFDDMPWSTEDVLGITRTRISDHFLTSSELPILSDIDYIEDWEAYGL